MFSKTLTKSIHNIIFEQIKLNLAFLLTGGKEMKLLEVEPKINLNGGLK